MLIEFSVTNFRSFREKQTLSMVAAPKIGKKKNVIKPLSRGEKLPSLLKVAAIYGPNASGKSNLIKALTAISEIASATPAAIPDPLKISPFRFDPNLANKPSEFEIHFIVDSLRYQFDLHATANRIFYERLIVYPRGVAKTLYERTHSLETESDHYLYDGLEGDTTLHKAWQQLTGARRLFIAQVVANSSDDLQQLKRPFEFLSGGLQAIDAAHLPSWASVSQDLAQRHPDFANQISAFLQEIDIPVTDIKFDSPESNSKTEIGSLLENKKKVRTTLVHSTALGEAEFDFEEESAGTQNLIGFWLPWMLSTKRPASRLGFCVLLVDEFDNSIHPTIVANLIEKHLNLPIHVQLIFTTHDTHLMDTKLLRRDQIWLAERDKNGASHLHSIHDFIGREGEDVEKRYYEGRYRGLPIVRS